ncbi:MAG: hypothetical protein HQL45_12985 [Alphaproteobacteria bacterium]|nr:hypothetical protein [Alphaproteobacteria bacterium]
MNIVIVQARMASTRLQGKALLHVGSLPLIHHVLCRAKKIANVNDVVLATSLGKENDPLAAYANSLDCAVFRGDEENVIERFYEAALERKASTVIRLTGDNPMIDFSAMSSLLDWHNVNRNDYSCMTGFPCGALGDVFSFDALEGSHRSARGKTLNDHVDLHVLENMDVFRVMRRDFAIDLSSYRWTIDDKSDLDRMSLFASKVEARGINMDGLLTLEAIDAIRDLGFGSLMCPKIANVSPENSYTAELVSRIERYESWSIDDYIESLKRW